VKKVSQEDWGRNLKLFEFTPDPHSDEPKTIRLKKPLWTENKAKFITRYLYYFVLVTKHGTYIDGFAGPQYIDKPDAWAAKLVLESEPRLLRHFYLVEKSPRKAGMLEKLKTEQPSRDKNGRKINREIIVRRGDMNRLIPELLSSNRLHKEATLCLLDQRTFECHWATVKQLAQYKGNGEHKIELFYFLATSWLRRAISGLKRNENILKDWWGRSDWAELKTTSAEEILLKITDRMRSELRYASVKAYPIFDRQSGGRKMYHMIHATDHPIAPELMTRAYNRALSRKEAPEQFLLALSTPEDTGSKA
jgi:three-Cys-motif partner protein